MKILFVTQVVPFPIRGGESLRSGGLLKSLLHSGHEVWVISPLTPDKPDLARQFPGAQFIPYVFIPEKISLLSQFAGYFNRDKKLIRLFNEILSTQHIDLAIIDYFFLGQYISFFKDQGIPVIYGTHNAQSRLRLQQPADGIMEKIVRLFSFLAQAWHERIYFKRADQLICVSEIDRKFYRRFIPDRKISVIPNFVDEASYKPAAEKKPYIIMTGNFHSFQNYYGLQWFLDNVWNKELARITELYLVGKGADEALSAISKGRNFHHVKVIENEDGILNYLASASAAVVPLWHGSGTRLKCIEAMALKTQLISTSIGAEGIDHGGGILIADTPGQFCQLIKLSLKKKVDSTDLAYETFINKYSLGANKNKINEIILSLAESKGKTRI
jgi:glycosyltransferase involved in cell wall biosynthesis